MTKNHMKKLTNKLTSKLRPSKQPVEPEVPSRITNDTVAEHREQILAGGRKFKYPVQYAKYKLVINSLLIGLGAIALLAVVCWYLLYSAQSSSKLMYRLTQLVPVPVAKVDGETVRYSEYLKKYRSDIFALVQQEQINLKSPDGKKQSEYYKRKELDNAVYNAYVGKLAREKKLSVTRLEIDNYITSTVNTKSISLEAYEKTVLRNYFDWSLDEYRDVVRDELLARKVGFAVDSAAKKRADDIVKRASAGDFVAIAKAESDDLATKALGGDVGALPIESQDVNGIIAAAKRMKEGQVSSPIQGVDGYFVIKLVKKTETTVQYSQIKVNLTELEKRFAAVQKAGKVKEYIKVEKG